MWTKKIFFSKKILKKKFFKNFENFKNFKFLLLLKFTSPDFFLVRLLHALQTWWGYQNASLGSFLLIFCNFGKKWQFFHFLWPKTWTSAWLANTLNFSKFDVFSWFWSKWSSFSLRLCTFLSLVSTKYQFSKQFWIPHVCSWSPYDI